MPLRSSRSSWLAHALVTVLGAGALAFACDDQGVSRAPTVTPTDGGTTSTSSSTSSSTGGPQLRPDGVVRVATYNVHLFFDTTCDSGKCGSTDFEQQKTTTQFQAEVDRIATAIEKLDADVIALEEVESQACLTALTDRLKADGFEYPVAKIGETGAPGSVDVAILARGSLKELKTHKQDPIFRPTDNSQTSFTRELLEMHLDVGGGELVMFAAHFRSQRDDDPGRRLAEASAARDIVTAAATAAPAAFVVLAGDLNDSPGSDTLTALEKGGGLVRLLSDYPLEKQGTFTFQGKAEAIDHLYAAKGQAGRYVAGTSVVVRDAAVGGLGSSDHAAVRADIKMK